MIFSLSRFWALMAIVALISGCIETDKLNAIRPAPRPKYERDDRPRVDIALSKTKRSFIFFLASECPKATLEGIARAGSDAAVSDKVPVNAGEVSLGKSITPPVRPIATDRGSIKAETPAEPKVTVASLCVDRISAYAVDQCAWMTRSQNKAALTTSLLTSLATIGGATATNIAILAHPKSASTSAAGLLGASVLANSEKIKILSPTSVPTVDMLKIGSAYAKIVGLIDDDLPVLRPAGTIKERAKFEQYEGELDNVIARYPGIKKLARIHDAVLSACTANAIGFGF